jgi:hypothetical protein
MEIKDKVEALISGLNSIFPGIEVQALKFGKLSEGLDSFDHIVAYLHHNNRTLVHTPYFFEQKNIIHFTKLEAIESIISNRNIRLYNLNSLDDPREFSFAGKRLNLDEDGFNHAKNEIYQISFCPQKILRNSILEFNMWRLFGDNGKGVLVLFSIHNSPMQWLDYHCSNILYGNKNRIVFVKLKALVNELNLSPPYVSIDLSKLIPFHKSRLYSLENEIRIISDRRKKISGTSSQIWFDSNEKEFPEIKVDEKKSIERGTDAKYIEIPIFRNLKKDVNDKMPLLKIEKILLGYNFSKEEEDLTKDLLTNLSIERIGYSPIIEPTRLREFYVGKK